MLDLNTDSRAVRHAAAYCRSKNTFLGEPFCSLAVMHPPGSKIDIKVQLQYNAQYLTYSMNILKIGTD